MNKKELKFILQEGEGLKLEFKESLNNIDKEIVAFANSTGGRIFLGITDDGKVKGIRLNNKLKSQIQDIAKNCDPHVKISVESFENIAIITIPEGINKPYRCSSGFFLRQGPNSQKLSRDEIIDFSISEGKMRFDSQINEDFDFPNEFDENKLDECLSLAGIKKTTSTEGILLNLGVAKKEKKIMLNNAGVLLFAKSPGKYFQSSKVVCVNYQTNEKVNILDRKEYDDGTIRNINDSINYIKKHIDTKFEIKQLKRKEIPQYPEDAIREAVVNAIMHRDYFDVSGDIVIEVFKNKLVISNPGGLIKGISEKDFGKISRTRNNIVASLLLRAGYIEKLGTGINRIKLAMKKASLPEPIFEYNGSFFITLSDNTFGVGERVGEKLTENQNKIIQEISKNPSISAKELSRLINISSRKIEENIAKLKQKGILKRIGPAKGGHWEIR
ncbi:MAG: putative DNA binding domain-containing protein [Nanoarchaeota archaeon]|nr:putative DNA binding domain-containing protein [Nanoarchaeota archaeon]